MRQPDLIRDGWALESGEDYHRAAPETFWIPSLADRENLQRGDYAKLIFRIAIENDEDGYERMWVVVSHHVDTGYVGRLMNEPSLIIENDLFWLGAELPFEALHVIDTMPGDANSLKFINTSPKIAWAE